MEHQHTLHLKSDSLRNLSDLCVSAVLGVRNGNRLDAEYAEVPQRHQRLLIVFVILVCLCVLSLAIFVQPNSSSIGKGFAMSQQEQIKVRAPEIKGGSGWLNTDRPLSLAALKGKVVLLDFWTYGCINCIHIIPDLKKLEAKYPNELVVIGVHSAKFKNEKETENIRRIILRYEIEHPVYNDSEFSVWQSYRVRSWPTQVLIDPAGYAIVSVSGEGNYEVIDQAIAQSRIS